MERTLWDADYKDGLNTEELLPAWNTHTHMQMLMLTKSCEQLSAYCDNLHVRWGLCQNAHAVQRVYHMCTVLLCCANACFKSSTRAMCA